MANAGEQIGRAEEGVARQAAPWIERLARLGYAAKALLYATIGGLAAQVALGTGGEITDSRGALRTVLQAPYGRVMLVVIAAGLLGYALWRLVEAVTDPEGRGTDAKGIALRASYAVRGLLYLGVALSALRLATGSASGGGDRQDEWTAWALDLPGGTLLVWAAGAGVVGFGLYQLYRAYAVEVTRRLELGSLSPDMRRWAIGLSRFGIAARGVVFCLVGSFLVRAASQHNARAAGGVEQSLDVLAGIGTWPLAVVAGGLVAYGAYELLKARYRRIRAG